MRLGLILCCLAVSAVLGNEIQNPDSPFGVVCPWTGIGDSGIGWVRCGAGCTALDWGAINKARGVYDWTEADKEVESTYGKEKADLLVILGYTPRWASSGPNGENNYPPKDLSDWSNFVSEIVARYKNRVKYWEVWNEPDIGFWQGSIAQYAELLKSAYVAAKKSDPTCRIVFGGMAGVNLPFLQRVYELGCREYFDVMAVHPYQWGETFDDEWFAAQLCELRKLMMRWGDTEKEIWLTEIGWSTGSPGIDEETQSNLLAQAMVITRTLQDIKVSKCFWFSVKDWGGPGYGLIRSDGTQKPALLAYKEVIAHLAGAKYIRSYGKDGVRCHLFAKDGLQMLVVWSRDKSIRKFPLPQGDWVRYEPLGGQVTELCGQSEIEVGPRPVLVYGKSQLASNADGERRVAGRLEVMSDFPGPQGRSEPAGRLRKRMAESLRKDIWYSIQIPESTTRLWLSRRNPKETPIIAEVHNDGVSPVIVELEARVGAFRTRARTTEPIRPGGKATVQMYLNLPMGYRLPCDTLEVKGRANGVTIPETRMQVRIADGPVIEFLANSTLEGKYLVECEGTGCAPSVRFGGTWTYRFDLSGVKEAVVDLCVGAHQANDWTVLVSRDRMQWQTLLAGKSNRGWQKADLTPYAGGEVFLKFTGNDQQLSELVLMTKR